MSLEMSSYLENRRMFLENRPKYPLEELARHAGRWIAWSPDGTRIVASAANPEGLEEMLRGAGEPPEECIIEGIPEGDSFIGGNSFQMEDR